MARPRNLDINFADGAPVLPQSRTRVGSHEWAWTDGESGKIPVGGGAGGGGGGSVLIKGGSVIGDLCSVFMPGIE